MGPGAERNSNVGVDDILESLSYRAQLSDTIQEAKPGIMQTVTTSRLPSLTIRHQVTRIMRRGSFGSSAFGLMLVAGILVVLFYGVVFDGPANLSLTDSIKLGIIALLCFISLASVRLRRSWDDQSRARENWRTILGGG